MSNEETNDHELTIPIEEAYFTIYTLNQLREGLAVLKTEKSRYSVELEIKSSGRRGIKNFRIGFSHSEAIRLIEKLILEEEFKLNNSLKSIKMM